MRGTADITAAYVRVSSDTSDVSRQRENISAWAVRNGVIIDQWFEDSVGKNPRHRAERRKAFQELLRAVESGLVKTIIVDSQDRFGTKDAWELGKFCSLLRDHGCRLLETSGRELTADDDGSILTGVVGALTSKREQREKGHRSLTAKILQARRGTYTGGYPAFGFDAVCFGADGKEKWRVVWVGQFDRWKVYPDGKRERFTGKNNSPAHDQSDTLRLRPSIESERIAAVKQIFKWYVKEDISPGQIADRLNEMKISPVFGTAFYKQTIRAILRNPIYLGRPAYNKSAGSEFVEYVDGQVKDVKGRVRSGRKRQQSDYIFAEQQEFTPIIDEKTWNSVQQKLAVSRGRASRRPPQVSELWLRPFLFCGHCGKPMHATNGRSTKGLWASYFCGTYNRFGRNNPTGCHCHRVHHARIEEIVQQYLTEREPEVAQLLKATEGGDVETVNAMSGIAQPCLGVACDMISYIAKADPIMQAEMQSESVIDTYRMLYKRLAPSIEAQLREKEAELDAAIDDFRGLPDSVRPRIAKQLESKQRDIDALKADLENLLPVYESLRADLERREAAIQAARLAMKRDGDGRRKADALAKVVDKVSLHFRHVQARRRKPTDAPKHGISRLHKIEIEPVLGEIAEMRIDQVGTEAGPS